jgi:C1A family cysteine protease
MSINADDSYHTLDQIDQPQSAKKKQVQQDSRDQGYSFGYLVMISLLFGLFCAIVAAGAVIALDNDYTPSQPYRMPNKAIISATFRAPFFDESFKQPILAYVDHEAQASRIEYYGGANVYITNKPANSTDYVIAPQYDRAVCFTNEHDGTSSLPLLFPKLHYKEGEESEEDSDEHGPKLTFSVGSTRYIPLYKRAEQQFLDGVNCDVWKYTHLKHDNSTSYDSLIPDGFSHVGEYTFYINAKTGIPVRFHMMGHSVFNGGSHMEEYFVDYHSVVAVDHIPSNMFAPPSGMTCIPDHIESSKRHRSPISLMTGSFSHQSPENKEFLQDSLFDQWAQTHQKTYTNAQEKATRKATFFKTVDMIAAHNAKPTKSYTMALNQFADYTAEELSLMSGRRLTNKHKLGKVDVCTQFVSIDDKDNPVPAKFNWANDTRVEAYLDPTVNHHQYSQIACGSCWAQGLSRAIGSQYYLVNTEEKYNAENKKDASVQHVLDCTNGPEYDVYGCNGGIDAYGASWLISKNGGLIATDESYSFINANGYCLYSINDKNISGLNPRTQAPVEKFTKVTACEHVGDQWNKDKEVDLVKLVESTKNALYYHGPLSVSIAVPQSLYYYQSGIYDDLECGHLNDDLAHTVTLLGYDSEEDYFLIANSWSTMWGINGSAKIKATGNICGVATTPLALSVEKK